MCVSRRAGRQSRDGQSCLDVFVPGLLRRSERQAVSHLEARNRRHVQAPGRVQDGREDLTMATTYGDRLRELFDGDGDARLRARVACIADVMDEYEHGTADIDDVFPDGLSEVLSQDDM